jgi:nucleoside 2-deoxyribosyltransferase
VEKLVYLAGPMEDSADNGLGWRVEFREALKEFDFNCIIPEEHEEGLIPPGANMSKIKRTNLDLYKTIVRRFIKLDLKFVEDADLIVIKYEGEQTSGTIGEAQYAYQLKKPVMLVSSLPEEQISGWFLSCCSIKFSSLEEMVEYITNHSWEDIARLGNEREED